MYSDINDNFLKCYTFYDSKFRRLSIFGKYNGNKLTIWVLTNSNKDTFSKKKAKDLFDSFISYREGDEFPQCSPEVFNVPSTQTNYKKNFINFCRTNYLIKQTFEVLLINKLIKTDVFFNKFTNEAVVNSNSLRIKNMSSKQIAALVRINEKNRATRNILPESDDEFNRFFNPKNINPSEQ